MNPLKDIKQTHSIRPNHYEIPVLFGDVILWFDLILYHRPNKSILKFKGNWVSFNHYKVKGNELWLYSKKGKIKGTFSLALQNFKE